jgi:hypothetical protein
MTKIKVTAGCSVTNQTLSAGNVYTVPEQVSEADAKVLLRLNKAIVLKAEPTTGEQAEPVADKKKST